MEQNNQNNPNNKPPQSGNQQGQNQHNNQNQGQNQGQHSSQQAPQSSNQNSNPAARPVQIAPQKNNPGTAQKGAVTKSNKQLWISGAVVLALIILVLALPKASNTEPEEIEPVAETELTPIDSTTIGAAAVSAVPSTSLTRTEALETYATSTIVFNAACAASPKTLELAAGTTLLLDNPTAAARVVTVGDKQISVGAYKYRTTKLNTAGTFSIACDTVASAASVVVK